MNDLIMAENVFGRLQEEDRCTNGEWSLSLDHNKCVLARAFVVPCNLIQIIGLKTTATWQNQDVCPYTPTNIVNTLNEKHVLRGHSDL